VTAEKLIYLTAVKLVYLSVLRCAHVCRLQWCAGKTTSGPSAADQVNVSLVSLSQVHSQKSWLTLGSGCQTVEIHCTQAPCTPGFCRHTKEPGYIPQLPSNLPAVNTTWQKAMQRKLETCSTSGARQVGNSWVLRERTAHQHISTHTPDAAPQEGRCAVPTQLSQGHSPCDCSLRNSGPPGRGAPHWGCIMHAALNTNQHSVHHLS
jgi:hypothetical protein